MKKPSRQGERMDAENNGDISRHGECDQCFLRDAEFTFAGEWWCESCLLGGVLADLIDEQIDPYETGNGVAGSLEVTLDGHYLDEIIFRDGKDEIHVINQTPLLAELRRLEREATPSTH